MSLDLQTITGDPLPTDDLHGYSYQASSGKTIIYKVDNTAHNLLKQSIVPFPPASFAEASFAVVPVNTFPTSTITKLLASSRNYATKLDFFHAILTTATGTQWPRYNAGVADYYGDPRQYAAYELVNGIGVALGGNDGYGPSSIISLSTTGSTNSFPFLSYDLLNLANCVITSNFTNIYSLVSDGVSTLYALLNPSTGLCAKIVITNWNVAPTVTYFTLDTGGGTIKQLLYTDRLIYLLEKADTTLWLYDANNNGTSITQVSYSSYDPSKTIKFALVS